MLEYKHSMALTGINPLRSECIDCGARAPVYLWRRSMPKALTENFRQVPIVDLEANAFQRVPGRVEVTD